MGTVYIWYHTEQHTFSVATLQKQNQRRKYVLQLLLNISSQ